MLQLQKKKMFRNSVPLASGKCLLSYSFTMSERFCVNSCSLQQIEWHNSVDIQQPLTETIFCGRSTALGTGAQVVLAVGGTGTGDDNTAWWPL